MALTLLRLFPFFGPKIYLAVSFFGRNKTFLGLIGSNYLENMSKVQKNTPKNCLFFGLIFSHRGVKVSKSKRVYLRAIEEMAGVLSLKPSFPSASLNSKVFISPDLSASY